MKKTIGIVLLAALGLPPGFTVDGYPALLTGAGGDQAATTVVRYGGQAAPLAERWSWATSEAGKKGFAKGYWVGYSIEKTMGERSFIGSFYSDDRRNKPSLRELVTGMEINDLPPYPEGEFGSMSGFVTFDDEKKPAKLVKKEVGILLHVGEGGSGEIEGLEVSNLSLRVDLEGAPLLWLGAGGYDESVGFLEKRYREASTVEAKKRFVLAIGIHDESAKAIGILKDILSGDGDTDLRGDAAFWLGQTDNDAARVVLQETARNDPDEDIREKCIFALSQMESEAALDAIIDIARNNKYTETRKNAAFWLGQMAGEKALGTLKDLAYNDEDTEVQRSAVFALTQGDEKSGKVDELIKIARNHPNPRIRKEAIFWLGQCEDPRAIEVLVEMAKGK